MLGVLEKYCPKCGYRIRVHEERYCHGCGIPIKKPKDTDLTTEDVKDIPYKEVSPIDTLKEEKKQFKSKNILSTVLYMFAGCGMIITLLLVMNQIIPPMYLPVVVLISLIGISFVDGFQPRDKKNIENQFVDKPILKLRHQQKHHLIHRGVYKRKMRKLVYK